MLKVNFTRNTKRKKTNKILCASLSARETRRLGKVFAQKVLEYINSKKDNKGAVVLALRGDLGGGKTTFVQGFAKGLGIKERVLSPTFVIMKKYQIPTAKNGNLFHIDCYRINSEKDLSSIGFYEILKNPRNIIVIEWAEKIKRILPQNTIWINFEFVDIKKRRIYSSWCG